MKRILFLLLLTVSVYGQNPSRFAKIQITGNTNSGTATKVNVQEANGEVNTQTINTGFNKNIGLGGSDIVGATTLLNQYSTTPVDWTATAFNSGQVVFYGGKQWIAKMATVAGDVPEVSQKWEEITFESLANKTVAVDQTIIDGSTNAVSGNAVFDGLASKANNTLGGIVAALGYTPENVANKATDFTTVNNTLYPSVQATKNYVDSKVPAEFSNFYMSDTSIDAVGNKTSSISRVGKVHVGSTTAATGDFQVTGQTVFKTKNSQNDGGQLGSELLTTGSSDTSWTGSSFVTGYTHVPGSTTVLTSTLTPIIGNLYQITYTVTGRTAGSFTIAFGGDTNSGVTATGSRGPKATTTGTLVITPTSDFNGTIVLSIKLITAGIASVIELNSSGTVVGEKRIFNSVSRVASGVQAGQNNTTGTGWVASGFQAGQNNTTGSSWVANGYQAGQNNTTGSSWLANGVQAGQNNTTGSNWVANGYNLNN
jgi:hypothetical protein